MTKNRLKHQQTIRNTMFFTACIILFNVLMLSIASHAVDVSATTCETKIDPQYIRYINETCSEYGIAPEFVTAIVERESEGNPDAYNEGCIGLMQIYEKYHKDRMQRLSVTSLYDPKSNIKVGVDYLYELFLEYNDPGTVLMVYNGSKNAVTDGRNANYTDYAEWIIKRSEELEMVHGKR